MRKLQYAEYMEEYKNNDEYLRDLVKILYKPVLKRYCEKNGVRYNGVDDGYVIAIKNKLIIEGKAEIAGAILNASFETVLVVKTYSEYEYEDIKDLPDYANDKFAYDEDKNIYTSEYEDTLMRVSCSISNILYEIFTATEAAELWGLNESTIRKAILNPKSKFILDIDYRKAGSVTLITKKAMERVYGLLNTNKY